MQKALDEQLSADEDEEGDLEEFEANEGWSLPDDLERERAKRAYDEVTKQLRRRDLNSDTLFEDLLSEKAYELRRFVPKKPKLNEKERDMKISHKDMQKKDQLDEIEEDDLTQMLMQAGQ